MEDCLFYDKANTNNLSNYDISSNLNVTWETDGYYKIYQNIDESFGYCNLLNKTFPNKVIIETDVCHNYSVNNQLRIGLYNPNNSNNGVITNFAIASKSASGLEIRNGIANATSEGWSNILTSFNHVYSTDTWYTLRMIIDEQNITVKFLDSNNTVLKTLTASTSSSILSSEGNMLCIEHCHTKGVVSYVKNLKIKPYASE